MTRRAMLYGGALLAATTVSAYCADVLAQQLVSPPDTYMSDLISAPAHDDFWIYVMGLSSGANAAWIASTGEPLFCHPHPATDVEQTRQVILRFLTTLDIEETTILEAVVPGAFAAAYPCGGPAL